jgi:regulatory protein
LTLELSILRSTPLNSQEQALQRAVRFLGYRPRSAAEVLSYLTRRGYSTAVVEKTLEKLRSLNYVNDKTFARNWARSRSENRGHGPKRIEQELRTKGIGPVLIRETVCEVFAPGEEAEKAKILLARRFKNQKINDPKILRRAATFLQRRGYSADIIFDLLKVSVGDD